MQVIPHINIVKNVLWSNDGTYFVTLTRIRKVRKKGLYDFLVIVWDYEAKEIGRIADRIVGINTVTTKVVVVLAIFGFIMNEYFFLDLAIVLLMVNAVGGLILAKYMEGAR